MVWLIIQFIALGAVIVVAGTFLARFAGRLGELTGIGGSLAGVVLLAIATSLPELTVDCYAATIPAPDLAVGDLLGSCLYNLMILAFLDLSYQSGARMLSRTAAAHALSAVACMHLTAVALLFMLLELPWSLGPLGAGGLAILIAYLFCLRLIALDQRCQQVIAAAETRETDPRHSKKDLRRSLVGYFTCVLVVLAAAPLLAITADHLAAASGLGGTFVGTSMVALATSLPEVVTTRTAVKMGAYDMAIGNILGSNAFNIAIIPAVDLFFDGPLLASISSTHSVTAAAVILITGVAAMGLLYRAEKRYFFFEPDAALVIVLSIASLGLVYWIG